MIIYIPDPYLGINNFVVSKCFIELNRYETMEKILDGMGGKDWVANVYEIGDACAVV